MVLVEEFNPQVEEKHPRQELTWTISLGSSHSNSNPSVMLPAAFATKKV
jgi:hypothetical protein